MESAMALINGVNFEFIKTDSTPCGVEFCDHFAVVTFMPKDRWNRSSKLYCLNHLLKASARAHSDDVLRLVWL